MKIDNNNTLRLNIRFVAHDYGFDKYTNERVKQLVTYGPVNSISVFGFNILEHDITDQFILKRINWGVHLYLPDQIMVMNDRGKKMENSPELSKLARYFNLILGRVNKEDIFNEFEAQILQLKNKNIPISFVDTHQNIHGYPIINSIVRNLSRKYNLEANLRPIAQISFNFKKNSRIIFSNIYSKFINFRPKSRVLVGCPGYEKEDIDIEDVIRQWDIFFKEVKKKSVEELVVPCHPGTSPAEIVIYSSTAFYKLLEDHNIQVV